MAEQSRILPLLLLLNLLTHALNSFLMPIREGLTLDGGKSLQIKLMMLTVLVSVAGQTILSGYIKRVGAIWTLSLCFRASSVICSLSFISLTFLEGAQTAASNHFSRAIIASLFYLWFAFYNMASVSLCWTLSGDLFERLQIRSETQNDSTTSNSSLTDGKKVGTFGYFAAAGTVGQILGSLASSASVSFLGGRSSILVLITLFLISMYLCGELEKLSHAHQHEKDAHESGDDLDAACDRNKTVRRSDHRHRSATATITESTTVGTTACTNNSSIGRGMSNLFSREAISNTLEKQYEDIALIFNSPILFCSFLYQIFLSICLGLTVIERTSAAKRSGIGSDGFSNIVAENQVFQGVVQFLMQYLGSGILARMLGLTLSLSLTPLFRLFSFLLICCAQTKPGTHTLLPHSPQLTAWYLSSPTMPVVVVVTLDVICRIGTHSVTRPVREALWTELPKDTKYRAKLMVDVMAHRIGTSLAAVIASVSLMPAMWLLKGAATLILTTLTPRFKPSSPSPSPRPLSDDPMRNSIDAINDRAYAAAAAAAAGGMSTSTSSMVLPGAEERGGGGWGGRSTLEGVQDHIIMGILSSLLFLLCSLALSHAAAAAATSSKRRPMAYDSKSKKGD